MTKINLEELYRTDPVRACRLALRRTRGDGAIRLDKINALLGLYGTEAIRGDWQNGYWCDIVAVYCNTGDTYDVTVLQVRGDWSGARSRFFIGTMGDFVERNTERFAIQ